MKFNYAREWKKFCKEWEQKRAEYIAAGMIAEAIEELYQFDLEVFRQTRTYENRIVSMVPATFDAEDGDESKSDFINRFRAAISVTPAHFTTTRYSWVDEIDNPVLYQKLKELSVDDIELITLLVFDELSQTEIAKLKKVAQPTIAKKLKRIKKYLTFFNLWL